MMDAINVTDVANAPNPSGGSEGSALLLEHGYRVGEEWVVCRLYRVDAGYRVEIEGFGMCASSALGRDVSRSAVRAVYDALVRNTVTPCALEDVLEDWREEIPTVGLWQ